MFISPMNGNSEKRETICDAMHSSLAFAVLPGQLCPTESRHLELQ